MDEACRLRRGEGYEVHADEGLPYDDFGILRILSRYHRHVWIVSDNLLQ
ncbi:MAG: hypothetical protein LUE89_08255 [Clostridiales bacterium]|nr:hypothetical protein [Clostridiales bacterium]